MQNSLGMIEAATCDVVEYFCILGSAVGEPKSEYVFYMYFCQQYMSQPLGENHEIPSILLG